MLPHITRWFLQMYWLRLYWLLDTEVQYSWWKTSFQTKLTTKKTKLTTTFNFPVKSRVIQNNFVLPVYKLASEMVAGSSTLPRAQSRVSDVADGRVSTLGDKVTAATSSTSLYDNVAGRDANKPLATGNRQTRDRETSTAGGKLNSNNATTQVPAQSQTEEVGPPFLHIPGIL